MDKAASTWAFVICLLFLWVIVHSAAEGARSEGYAAGMEDGYSDGFEQGYSDGYEDGIGGSDRRVPRPRDLDILKEMLEEIEALDVGKQYFDNCTALEMLDWIEGGDNGEKPCATPDREEFFGIEP